MPFPSEKAYSLNTSSHNARGSVRPQPPYRHEMPSAEIRGRNRLSSAPISQNQNRSLENRGTLPQQSLERNADSMTSSSQPRPGNRFIETAVDWRGVLCRFLKIGLDASEKTILTALEEADLKLVEAERVAASASESHDLTPRFRTIHRINCADDGRESLCLEEPFIVNSGPQNTHLRGNGAIHNFELFLERNKNVSFIAYKDYRCCGSSRSRRRRTEDSRSLGPAALLVGESTYVVSPVLRSALQEVTHHALIDIPHPDFNEVDEFPSPYLWWFCARKEIAESQTYLNNERQEHIGIFERYLQERLGDTWSIVDAMLQKGKISAQYIKYLYTPNTILISKSDNESRGQQRAYLAGSWLSTGSDITNFPPMIPNRGRPNNFTGTIEGVYWTFDGNFGRASKLLGIDWLPSLSEEFDIKDLMLYPINFAEPGLKELLRDRGTMFWKCRRRHYVCLSEEGNDLHGATEQRFMIDYATYKQMYSHDPKKGPQEIIEDDLEPGAMLQDNPPTGDSFLLCLPNTIPGFNMNKKEWANLEVSRISSVKWNTKAFESLVIDPETKELISALVTNQIDAEKSTDLMSGKGNGLFILLHGGPGTGKTLTAESVAEFSQKPLYRVTCGDIGTRAEDVEKYLEVVMLLGKTWGCVVLLDEADVFLEQRKISDLQRNALVSVFLRVLEYYDGILILTSNRVGHFDEAFKSRIQLTLRYKDLERAQRLKIWDNFITRLEGFQNKPSSPHFLQRRASSIHGGVDLGVNIDEVRAKIPELANAELNGREIRNAISTARQLSMFRKQKMGYEHLNIVIQEAKKFEDYLTTLQRGFSSNEIAQAVGAR